MRKIPLNQGSLLGDGLKVKSEKVFHNGKPISSFIENIIMIDDIEDEEEIINPSEIKDDITSEDKTWSSKKIEEEFYKCNSRINNLISLDKDSPVTSIEELEDLKIDIDGEKHTCVGDAVRSQLNKLNKKIENRVEKERFENINHYQTNSSSFSNDAIIVKSFHINGEDSNVVQVPILKGYILVSANNGDHSSCQCYTVGLSQENTTSNSKNYVFMNRVIKTSETLRLDCVYIRLQK